MSTTDYPKDVGPVVHVVHVPRANRESRTRCQDQTVAIGKMEAAVSGSVGG